MAAVNLTGRLLAALSGRAFFYSNRVPLIGRPRAPQVGSNSPLHRQQIARVANLAIAGQIDCSLQVTLAANVSSTTVTDSRIGPTTTASLTPNTAHAAAELAGGKLYVPLATIGSGSLVIQHSISSWIDRTFTLNLCG